MPRRRREFEPGEAGAEAAQLEQVERCRRVQIHWLSDAGRFTLFEREQYNWIDLTSLVAFLLKYTHDDFLYPIHPNILLKKNCRMVYGRL